LVADLGGRAPYADHRRKEGRKRKEKIKFSPSFLSLSASF
jgi:hypothetical protein